MNIGEILIWDLSNLLPLIPVVIGLVMLVRPAYICARWLIDLI